jgi:hydrogenase expression/formation protein HypC
LAEVNFDGVIKKVCIDFIPDIKVGEYVMVHVGYALNKVNENEARNQLKAISEAEEIIRKKMK